MMLVQSAGYEARIAVENAILGVGQPYTPNCAHGGLPTGVRQRRLNEEQARATEKDCVVAVVPYADLDRAVIDDHTEGFCN